MSLKDGEVLRFSAGGRSGEPITGVSRRRPGVSAGTLDSGNKLPRLSQRPGVQGIFDFFPTGVPSWSNVIAREPEQRTRRWIECLRDSGRPRVADHEKPGVPRELRSPLLFQWRWA